MTHIVLTDLYDNEHETELPDPLPNRIMWGDELYVRGEGVSYRQVEFERVHDTRKAFRIDLQVPERIEAYGVHKAAISGPTVIQREELPPVECVVCGPAEPDSDYDPSSVLCAEMDYHWHGALWRRQVIFCRDAGHVVFEGPAERIQGGPAVNPAPNELARAPRIDDLQRRDSQPLQPVMAKQISLDYSIDARARAATMNSVRGGQHPRPRLTRRPQEVTMAADETTTTRDADIYRPKPTILGVVTRGLARAQLRLRLTSRASCVSTDRRIFQAQLDTATERYNGAYAEHGYVAPPVANAHLSIPPGARV